MPSTDKNDELQLRLPAPTVVTAAAALSVRFLVAGTSTWTTELLGLASSRISHDQRLVILRENALDLFLGRFVNDYISNAKH